MYSKLVDTYFSEYVLMYTVKLVPLLLKHGSERDKFYSRKLSIHFKTLNEKLLKDVISI